MATDRQKARRGMAGHSPSGASLGKGEGLFGRLGRRRGCGRRDDMDESPVEMGSDELDRAVDQSEEGVIAADPDIGARTELGSALAHDDIAGDDRLAAELLDAET